jgi:Cobalamin biosynthesis protein CobT (nicotinate-mononucleotide:5, 6-dimethylbenzimidazole phosphoribosyltransferase)
MVRRDTDSDGDDDVDVNQQEYSDQDGDEDIRTFKATKRQRLMDGDDDSYRENESEVEKEEEDEDFDDDDVENEERDLFNDEMSFENDVESSSSSDDDDDVIVKNRTRTTDKASITPSKTRNINNDDIFDKEEDSNDDDDDGGNANRSPMKSIPLTPLKLKKIGQFRYESSEDEKEIVARSVKDGVPKYDESVELPETPKKIPLCTSEFDEITNERLPPLHVCYLAPDGKSRHCFCLETLYRAAILSGSKTRKDDGSGGLCFLQPPHFRTVMEDTLIDQIASRFGRQALVIENSKVYKDESKRKEIQTRYEIDDDDDDEEVRLSFRNRFNNYLNRQMGSGDIYCCPLCYTEAQRRFREGDDGSDDDDDDESENDNDCDNDKSGKGDSNQNNDDDDELEYNMDTVTSYTQIDPMSILGSLDHDEFEVAACFCFHKLSQVKNHVRVIHKIDTSNVEVNDFFKRFMVSQCNFFLYGSWILLVIFPVTLTFVCWSLIR